MFGAVIIVSLMFLAGTSYGQERCKCMVHHKQDHFCTSAFAMHVKIHEAVSSPLPGGTDIGFLYNKYMKYKVGILEKFKGDHVEGDIIDIYSPRGGICGRTGLFDETTVDASNEYLFLGDIAHSSDDTEYKVITNCNWVEHWEAVVESQRDGLRGMYTDCSCLAHPVSGSMEVGDTEADKFSYNNCLFNPVKALILKVLDCETLHGFCLTQTDNTCQWEDTDSFDQCFQSRKSSLTVSAAAVTTKEGCKVYTGRKKRQCILKFLKSRNQGGRR